jgi:hypothetical protein
VGYLFKITGYFVIPKLFCRFRDCGGVLRILALLVKMQVEYLGPSDEFAALLIRGVKQSLFNLPPPIDKVQRY